MIDIIRDRHISKEFLHWGREHLTHSNEELAAYTQACHIVNTDGYWYSQDVKDSKYIIKSKQVVNSIGVFSSTDINNSSDIVDSEDVIDSKQIFHSSMVEGSEKIFRGQNITQSINICNSTMIANSKNVIDSNKVFDSSEIIASTNVFNSYFCHNCKEIKHCMFCENLENAEYCLFNKPVNKKYFELFEKQYLKYLVERLDFVREWPEEFSAAMAIAPTRKFDDWYHPIPQRFWKWVRTLPNFDPMLIYNITMLPEILMD
jgi:hypothetical protein